MPGIFPSLANSRKQIRQRPKSLINPRPRPHRKHRFVARVENFGVLVALAFTLVLAMVITSKFGELLASSLKILVNVRRVHLLAFSASRVGFHPNCESSNLEGNKKALESLRLY